MIPDFGFPFWSLPAILASYNDSNIMVTATLFLVCLILGLGGLWDSAHGQYQKPEKAKGAFTFLGAAIVLAVFGFFYIVLLGISALLIWFVIWRGLIYWVLWRMVIKNFLAILHHKPE